MRDYQREFLDFAIGRGVLRFGEFTLKSGRVSPYFFNAGLFDSGAALARLGRCYAAAIMAAGLEFDALFGPAYKGIPLVATVAVALAEQYSRDVPWCFNRKEAKDHGEGGTLVGHVPQDGERALIVEDVTTAGTSIRETVPLLKHAASVTPAALVVSVDRMERGQGTKNALTELREEFGMATFAIANIHEIAEFLKERCIDGQVVLTTALYDRIQEYRQQYGGTE